MSELKPNKIIVHCGLHKTGSTYLQRNLSSNHDALLNQGILYLGPTTIKKQCRELWRYLQWGKKQPKKAQKLYDEILHTLTQQAGEAPKRIHTILISFEAIFGTLRAGLIKKKRGKTQNNENKLGLYRYSKRRLKRMMQALEGSLSTKDIDWVVCYATRQRDHFVRSCQIQLIKEGHILADSKTEDFASTSNFSHADPQKLVDTLNSLKKNRRVIIKPFSYEHNSDPSDLSIYLKNFINLTLPEQAKKIQAILIDHSKSKQLTTTVNPGINDRGLEIAKKARPIFTKSEWKMFRKFLEKNFVKTN